MRSAISLIFLLSFLFTSCITSSQSITEKNDKKAEKLFDNVYLKYGNAYMISSDVLNLYTLWFYNDGKAFVWNDIYGRNFKEDTIVNVKSPLLKARNDYDEYYKEVPLELDGEIIHCKGANQCGVTIDLNLPIDINSFKGRLYKDAFLNDLSRFIAIYNIWDVY